MTAELIRNRKVSTLSHKLNVFIGQKKEMGALEGFGDDILGSKGKRRQEGTWEKKSNKSDQGS